ncbi:MAG: 2Fe-2S iron-sulfur cluster-binding protein, partial [Methanoregula sp.]|nr:2Fe-2S iron-sulfur cluster-binding protein [Methanoregula sp.]
MKSYRVVFAPSFKEIIADEGKTVLDAARESGVYIDSQCNGKGKCGKCRIRVIEGKTSPFTSEETEFIRQLDRALGYRLACMTLIAGDIIVFVPGENILNAEAAKKVFSKRSNVVNPAVKSYTIDLSSEEGGARHAYFEGITRLLTEKYGPGDLTCDLATLQNLADIVKGGEDRVTVFVWMDREIIAVQPGWNETCLGLALDVGTTTVALYLCDLKNGNVIASGSTTNPQILFGADIMSRISYSANHPGQGVKKMQGELINSVNTLIDQMAVGNGFSPRQIVDMTVVGNTVMHHIFLGIAPDHLGLWPFTPSIQGSVDVKVRELGILINPSAYVHVLPVEAGFVGADNVGVLLSEEPYNQDE